jgi:class 3 adenylate cyclase
MEIVAHSNAGDVGRDVSRLVARAGLPAVVAFGLYVSLQLLLERGFRPPAIALGLIGATATNGVAAWLAGRAAPVAVDLTGGGDRPTGNVAFLFTDIEGSTALWERAPDAMGAALRRHDDLLLAAVRGQGGVVFSKAGDGIGAAFASADDAVTAALVAQRGFRLEDWPHGADLRVRFGIHVGRAVERDGDYLGPPVNRAARVVALAEPGTILVTRCVADAAWGLPSVRFRAWGTHRLRGVDGSIELLAVERERGPGNVAGRTTLCRSSEG